jgi:hypothetical protein
MPRTISKTLKEADNFQDMIEWFAYDIKKNTILISGEWMKSKENAIWFMN